jgi:transcriptional regulator with XRE-family HTH domain
MTGNDIGQEIKMARMAKGMTVPQLAGEIPSDTRTAFRYQKGRVKPDTMARISEVLEDPGLLPKYCSHCPVGQARKKYNLKRERPRYINRSHMMKLLKKFYLKFS